MDEEIGREEAPDRQHRKLRRHRGLRGLKECGSSEKLVTLQQPGRARDSWDNPRRSRTRVAAMSKTRETGCRRLAHWCGARRLRCGLDSSTQRQDERSRNVMRRGLQTVPESSRKQENKVNSACHELQWKHPQMSEHAMKSRTYRINRGVHGASWEEVVQNRICSGQWKA